MTVEERILQFGEKNPPFYLCDHDNGKYSLCLPLSFFSGPFENYGQEAFNRYALSVGDPVKSNGFYTHGSGYEWEAVFRKVFEQEPGLQEIDFDCEAGGFFCYCNDLKLLEDFGARFRAVCEDHTQFPDVVQEALSEAEQQAEYDQKHRTVKWCINGASRSSMEIVTPDQHLYIVAGQGRNLLKGKNITVFDSISGRPVEVNSRDLLKYHVTKIDDDFERGHIYMEAESPQSEDMAFSMTM